jgi:hypothetical protein
VPACLWQLKQLKSLQFDNREHQDAELARMLPSLRRLTALHIITLTTPIVAALSALPQLSALACFNASRGMALPAGSWLAPLRRLILPANLVRASFTVLEAAQHLQLVASDLDLYSQPKQQQISELVQWAAERVHMRWLLLADNLSGRLVPAEEEQVSQLQRQHPGITIRLFGSFLKLRSETAALAPDLAAFWRNPWW